MQNVISPCRELRRWDWQQKRYMPLFVPSEWNVATICDDMAETVNCANCGKPMVYGDTFCSLEIHTPVGTGYGVCRDCYKAEWQRRTDCQKRESELDRAVNILRDTARTYGICRGCAGDGGALCKRPGEAGVVCAACGMCICAGCERQSHWVWEGGKEAEHERAQA